MQRLNNHPVFFGSLQDLLYIRGRLQEVLELLLEFIKHVQVFKVDSLRVLLLLLLLVVVWVEVRV